MLENLGLAVLLVMLSVAIHYVGIMSLLRLFRHRATHLRHRNNMFGQGMMIMVVVMGLLVLHSAEIWAYAITYLAIGALGDLSTALYFSITTFSTIGYGDVVLSTQWRLFGVTEAVAGLLLFGWSTAFLIATMGYMRTFEHHWPDIDTSDGDAG